MVLLKKEKNFVVFIEKKVSASTRANNPLQKLGTWHLSRVLVGCLYKNPAQNFVAGVAESHFLRVLVVLCGRIEAEARLIIRCKKCAVEIIPWCCGRRVRVEACFCMCRWRQVELASRMRRSLRRSCVEAALGRTCRVEVASRLRRVCVEVVSRRRGQET